jgi:prevent-host-death family protein
VVAARSCRYVAGAASTAGRSCGVGDEIDRHVLRWLYVAMKRVGVAELKDQLSRHLRAVEAGAEVEVTDRHRPIARIVPVRAAERVAAQPSRRPFASIRGRRYPPAGWAVSSTALLLQERQGR